MKLTFFIDNLPQMLPTKFRFIWVSSFREEDFQKSTNLNQELPVAAIFANRLGLNEQSLQRIFNRYFLPNSIHLAQWFQRRRFFRNQLIRNKNCLWRPYLLRHQDEMKILYRRLSIDASYQVSVHLAKWFQRRFFQKSTHHK